MQLGTELVLVFVTMGNVASWIGDEMVPTLTNTNAFEQTPSMDIIYSLIQMLN